MKKTLTLLLLLPQALMAQIQFNAEGWEEAVATSRMKGTPIFLYAYASWCDPCQEMEDYTFSDLEVANFFNKNFINVAMDMEEYPGVELSETYAIALFPSYLFIDPNGNIIHRGCGGVDAQDMIYLGELALKGDSTLNQMETRYNEGERSTSFMLSYLDMLDEACLDAEQFARGYLASRDVKQLMEETEWEVFSAYQWDIFSREFQYVLNNQQKFEEKLGVGVVNAKLYDTYLAQYQEIFEAEELHDYGMRSLLHAMKTVNFTGADTLRLMMNLHYAEYIEDWSQYAEHAIALVGMTNLEDAEQLNELAWKFYLFIDNKNQLEIAASWARQAVDQLAEPAVIDTYASLQYKLGNKKQAIELEKQALEIAKELLEDVAHYEHQLKKFEGR